MSKKRSLFTRQFLGELSPAKQDRNFEKEHLDAYLRGDEYFTFGHYPDGKPKRYKVQQSVKKRPQ